MIYTCKKCGKFFNISVTTKCPNCNRVLIIISCLNTGSKFIQSLDRYNKNK